MTRRAALASADHRQGAFGILAAAGEGACQGFPVLDQNIDLAAQKLRLGVAEHMLGGAVDPLNCAVHIRRDDGVGRGIHDGMIACVLPLAQDPLAGGRNGHVIDLQQAIQGTAGGYRPDDDVVHSSSPPSPRSGRSVFSA